MQFAERYTFMAKNTKDLAAGFNNGALQSVTFCKKRPAEPFKVVFKFRGKLIFLGCIL